MFAFEPIAGLPMIEFLWIPLDERKVPSIVFGMTSCAFLAGSVLVHKEGVSATMGGDPCRDLGMTLQAPENCLAASKLMASAALRSAVQVLMGCRKRARRYLGDGGDCTDYDDDDAKVAGAKEPDHSAAQAISSPLLVDGH